MTAVNRPVCILLGTYKYMMLLRENVDSFFFFLV